MVPGTSPYTPDQFFRSPAMETRVRDLLEESIFARGGIPSSRCACLIYPEYRDEGHLFYRVVKDPMLCDLHRVGYEPIRFIGVVVDPADPCNPAKVKMISSTRTVGEGVNRAIDHGWDRFPEDDGRRDPRAVTVYRDIELAHEDETRVNRAKFDPAVPHIAPGTEVTADNWMELVGVVRRL